MWFFTDRKQAEEKVREIEKSKSNVNLIHLGTDQQGEQIVKKIENKIKIAILIEKIANLQQEGIQDE
jgi:hypothetical protein